MQKTIKAKLNTDINWNTTIFMILFHMGWILQGTAQQHDDAVMRRYAPDLMKDPVHVWLNRLYFVPLILCGIGLLALGGWPALMWGIFFRVTFGLHATWLVNSATHL